MLNTKPIPNYDITKRYIHGKGKSIIKQISTSNELCVIPGEPCSYITFDANLLLLAMTTEKAQEEVIYADYFLLLNHDKVYYFSKNTACRYNPKKQYVRFYDPCKSCQFIFRY